MALPIIPKKFFDVKSKFIPKGKMTLSPFNTGMEDILLQVKDSPEVQEKISALKQIIEACAQNKTDVGELPIFIIEELFVRLMQHSVSEFVDLAYICNNKIDTISEKKEECGERISLQIDLQKFKLKEETGHTNTVIIEDKIGIKFKYPNINMSDIIDRNPEFTDIIQCIDVIFDGDEVHSVAEETQEEIIRFWKQLTLHQKKEVYTKFFDSMPHMHYKTNLICTKCNHNHDVEFNSVIDLFQ